MSTQNMAFRGKIIEKAREVLDESRMLTYNCTNINCIVRDSIETILNCPLL